ncbi:unnamed protein product [Rotaria sp. Silwood2]|nr:unnamed protein product [Rotaria sp. Silwood2]
MQDGKKAEILLQWADKQFLAQALPNSPTSLRSDRVIDYAFVRGLNLNIQVYNGNTTSDHFSILSVIPLKVLQQKLGKNTHWKIEVWLNNRRCFIEINGSKSRWFTIKKGGPQGSVLTPTLFITYNCDMGSSLSSCTSHFFADDLARIMAGQLGTNYSSQ